MNRQVTASPGVRLGFNLATISRFLLLIPLALAVPATLGAQETDVVTLIPTSVQPASGPLVIDKSSAVYLHFQGIVLPPQAKVTKASLSLVSSKAVSAALNIAVSGPWNSVPGDPGQKAFGQKNLDGQFSGRTYIHAATDLSFLAAISPGGEQSGKEFWLTLKSGTGSGATSQWYALDASDSKFRPRLIVEYVVPGQPVTQSDGLPAVQSPRAYLPVQSSTPQNPTFFYVTRPFPTAWSYTPAFYGNLVYLVTDNGGKLQAFDALGAPVWALSLGNEHPGQHLLVSKTGSVYIVGNGKILVTQLDSANPRKPPQSYTAFANANLNPTAPPLFGLDGSLYFVNNQQVYGLNPYRQELWKVTLADLKTSRLTVDPSGEFVYLIAQNQGFVTINAQTGEFCEKALPNQQTLKGVNAALHAPVVIVHPDGTDKIYAAANSIDAGVIASFNNSNHSKMALDCGNIKFSDHKYWPPADGLWSQPIPDQLPVSSDKKKIYAAKVDNSQGALQAMDWLDSQKSGNTISMTPVFKVDTAAPGPYLLQGGNLTSDTDGEFFLWNGTDAGLYAFGPKFSGLLAPNQPSGISKASQLFFGTDGTLYANDAAPGIVIANPVLRAIVPQFTFPLNPDSGATITSATHLRVDGTIDKATVLKAGGSVLLGTGFTVKQGATLTIATGQP